MVEEKDKMIEELLGIRSEMEEENENMRERYERKIA